MNETSENFRFIDRELAREIGLEEDADDIFSFALMNKIRIIGLKQDAEFHIVWYDKEHQFCPSTR